MATATYEEQDHTPTYTWALDLVGLLVAISPAVIFLASMIEG